ncbi:hypothetical protein [Actinomadura sp. 9N407]|uniref:hypothetical protein n=1 Tax=Actinomadura sp. 9N407 TaxID=3375154 RepID=UPI0037A39C14
MVWAEDETHLQVADHRQQLGAQQRPHAGQGLDDGRPVVGTEQLADLPIEFFDALVEFQRLSGGLPDQGGGALLTGQSGRR